MEQFSCKTKIFSGTGSINRLKALGSRRLFLVSDPYFVENKTAEKLLDLSGAVQTEIFSKITPDPSVELVAEGVLQLQNFQPDTVVALGGGSAMDCAKAMAHFSGVEAQFVAIPTTSGSGSEVTDFAVLTQGNVKYPLVDEKLRPDMAILDGDLLKNLPKSLIADTGFDVLTHAIEGYVARDCSAFSDGLGEKSFCMAMENLPRSFHGDMTAREKMHEASTLAGLCFTHAGLGLCHAMSHALGGALHLPHGRLNGILLPTVLKYNSAACGEKYAKLAHLAGISGSSQTMAVRNLCNQLIKLRRELGLPKNLKEAGADLKALRLRREEILNASLSDPCAKGNPREVDMGLVCQVLDEVTGDG